MCSREILKSKRKELNQQGKRNKPNATRALEQDEVDKQYEAGFFFGLKMQFPFNAQSGENSSFYLATRVEMSRPSYNSETTLKVQCNSNQILRGRVNPPYLFHAINKKKLN